MLRNKKRQTPVGHNEANITPLADVTTTLIVVFLITMPALMWSGFDVNQAETGGESPQVQPTQSVQDDLLTIAVTVEGLKLNGTLMTDLALERAMQRELAGQHDRTVLIVPDGEVALGRVVTALDIAKASGAENLALLNRIGG